jgi:hypothetical protein
MTNAGGDMRANGEAGEGKLGTIIWVLILIGLAIAAWNVGPVFVANYSFTDKVNQLARVPKYRFTDDKLMDEIMKAAVEEKLEGHVTRQTCRINTMESRRTINCAYNRTVNVIPGWTHTFSFKSEADQPLL